MSHAARLTVSALFLAAVLQSLDASAAACPACKPVVATDYEATAGVHLPGSNNYGPDGKEALVPSRSYVITIPVGAAIVVSVHRDAQLQSEGIIYKIQPAGTTATVKRLWSASVGGSTVYIRNTTTTPASILLASWWPSTFFCGTEDQLKFCFDWHPNREKVLHDWNNSSSIGADDLEPGDGDYNDLLFVTTCGEAEIKPPAHVSVIQI